MSLLRSRRAVHTLGRVIPGAALAACVACARHGTGAPPSTVAPAHESAEALLARAAAAVGDPSISGFTFDAVSTTRRGWQQARDWRDSTGPASVQQHYVMDLRGRRFSYDQSSVSPGAIRFYLRTVHDTTGGWQIDLLRWRTGTDVARAPAAQSRTAIGVVERLLPNVLLRQARGAPSGLADSGTVSVGGRTLHRVAYTDPGSGQIVALDVDPATALPAAVRVGATRVEYDDYRRVEGVWAPFRRVTRTGAQPPSEQRVTRVSLGGPPADSLFRVPAGYADPPAPGAPHATPLAEGVYRLDDMPGGYHAAFVVQDDGVTVLEAPQDSAYGAIALRLIGEAAPGAPIARVLVTHHHNDHVGGLAPYVAAGATLVVGAGIEEAIRRQLPAPLRTTVRLAPVSARQSVGTGARRIDVLPVPNTHADGTLAFWVPAAGVLFQGDLFYIPERGDVPPAFEVTEALARVVRDAGLAVRQVVGVHGRTGTWGEVEQSLRRR